MSLLLVGHVLRGCVRAFWAWTANETSLLEMLSHIRARLFEYLDTFAHEPSTDGLP